MNELIVWLRSSAADETIEKGELVSIRDMTHKKPLAIGWSIMAGSEMAEASKGKGIKTLLVWR